MILVKEFMIKKQMLYQKHLLEIYLCQKSTEIVCQNKN